MKKLALNKETVRSLNTEEVGEIIGGGTIIIRATYFNTCICPILTNGCWTTTISTPTTTVTTDTTGPISISIQY